MVRAELMRGADPLHKEIGHTTQQQLKLVFFSQGDDFENQWLER